LHPILLRIGSFRLPTYGPILAVALLSALIVAMRLGRREGFDSNLLLDFSVWLIVAGLIGAKIYMLFTDWISHLPVQIFSMDTLEAGGGIYGGLIGAMLFAVVYVRWKRLAWGKLFDAFAPAVALGQGIGRWGCFAAGDDYGRIAPAHSHFAVVFTSPLAHQMTDVPLNVPVYPTQLFESVACLAAFFALLWLYRHKTRDGQIFAAYVMMYAVIRFIVEYYRGDMDRGFFFHHQLSTPQLCSIVGFAAGCAILLVLRHRAESRPAEVGVSASDRETATTAQPQMKGK
jgi:phosphatidylglycerol---prolipoprotein diacylglyceryl transferase